MTYRIGNLDTPDDCVEKLDMDILSPYRSAREKQWRGEALTPQEREPAGQNGSKRAGTLP